MIIKSVAIRFLIFFPMIAFAHEGHHHGAHSQEAKKDDSKAELKLAFEQIQADYISHVQSIFDTKCAACHSSAVMSPWYSSIPGVHQIVEHDRSEAKEHLEISKGFPFAGHGEPIEDLDAIKDAANKGTMPTWLYSLMHPSAKLTVDEKAKIIAWVDKSKALLSGLKPIDQNH
jgi:hypothetical protein